MPGQRSNLLYLTLTPTSADLAEVRRSGGGIKVSRRSTFAYPDGVGLDRPAELGKALAQHIEQTGYAERHAVIGLCPRWVLTRHKPVPAADSDTMRGIVNLQIERDFAASAAEITFDYLQGQAEGTDAKTPLLVAGVRTSIIRQAEQAAEAAGLKVEAITPTSLAAARQRSGVVALIEQGVAGVMLVRDGHVLSLTSCPADPDRLSDDDAARKLLADLSRCVLQLPRVEDEAGLTLIIPTSVSEEDAQRFKAIAADRFGSVETEWNDAAVVLAQNTSTPNVPLIDFTASKLTPPKTRSLSPTMQWAVRAAVLVLLVGGTFGYLWFDATDRRDTLQAEYDTIKDKAETLDKVLGDANLASGWYDKRPQALDCMLELTRSFPSRGEIRVETLTFRDDLTGQIDCAAEDRETMDDYFTKMQSSTALLQINRGSVRPIGGNSTWINFPIDFRFDPAAQGAQP